MEPSDLFTCLEQRVGAAHLAQRMHAQTHYVSRMCGQGLTYFHIENMLWLMRLIRGGLRLAGLYRRGQANALRHVVRRNRVSLPRLAPAFDGFTLLHLSDLHLDIHPRLPDALAAALDGLSYDVCVLTGDYRALTFGPYDAALAGLARLRPALRGPVYAVLGNHDFIEMVPPMEALDIRLLLNEHIVIERGGAALRLAGVDDPHFYETDNIQKACPPHVGHEPAVLLAHSPEIYRKAAACGFDLTLCGHTHAGQICLPGGLPVFANARVPRRFARGAWQHLGMQGYTSAGAGVSGVDVRYWCPPEVTLHTLARAGNATTREQPAGRWL